jgi:hypothetical protein
MSKNLTRKGIAFGAFVALASTVFAGTPASAAVSDSIVTGLTTGTSYNSVVGYANELSLSTVLAPSNSANAGTLHYAISNPSGAKLEIKVGTTANAVAQVTADGAGNTGAIWETAALAISAVDGDGVTANFQTTLTSFNVVPTGNQVGSAAADNLITIGVLDADLNVDVTVYAWLDSSSNAENIQASTELYGNTVALKFYDQANVTATTELVTPTTGAASVQATFTTTPELNGEQLGADFLDASVTSQGNANAVLAKNTTNVAAAAPTLGTTTYSGTTKKWTSTAYLKYSKATDAFNGTDGTVASIANLSTAPASSIASTDAELVTLTTVVHGLGATNTGSFAVTAVNLATAGITALAAATETAKAVTIASTSSISFTTTTALTTVVADTATAGAIYLYSVGTNATVQASGTYSFRPYLGTLALGVAGSSAVSAITANDTKSSISVSTDVAAGYNADASAADTVEVRTGTTTVSAVSTVYYTDADTGVIKVAPAGIPVTGTLSSPTGTFQINASGVGVTSDVELTDASGKVTFTVTTTTASSATNAVTLQIQPQSIAADNASGAKFVFAWDDAAYTLFDLKSSTAQPGANAASYRRIATGGVYSYDFAVLDQWGKAADAAKYRLQVINSGRTVSSNTHTLSNGRVSVGVADGAQGSGTTIQTEVNVQLDVSGTWTTQATESWDGTGFGYSIINVAAATAETITLDIEAGTTYQSTYQVLTADLVDAIAADTAAAQDRRISKVNQPTYTNAVTLNGRVSNTVTGQALGGGFVTITGASNILFSSGNVDAFGSITVLADADGDFGVNLYSNKSQEDSVITITSANAGTKTQKVTFSAAGARSGTVLTVTAPAIAQAGRTILITGQLNDKWGNGVDTDQDAVAAAGASALDATDARLVVSYDGPGLISGSLPVETDSTGKFTVRVLLGSNETGLMTVKATYGAANGTISSADTGLDIDLVGTAGVNIGTPAATAATAAIAGSTNRIYVSVSNNTLARNVVVKIAGKTVATLKGSTAKKTYVVRSTKGSKKVTVYVGGKLIASKTVTVK